MNRRLFLCSLSTLTLLAGCPEDSATEEAEGSTGEATTTASTTTTTTSTTSSTSTTSTATSSSTSTSSTATVSTSSSDESSTSTTNDESSSESGETTGGAQADCDTHEVSLIWQGDYRTGVFDESAAEIVAYDSESEVLFVVNGDATTLDRIDISDPTAPTALSPISLVAYGGDVTSVDVHDGVVAAAVPADVVTDTGLVVFFDADGTFLSQVTVGALPDMLTFTPDGGAVVVANEGEPNDDYTIDPEGSVSIIDLTAGADMVTDLDVSTATFAAYDGDALPTDVRRFGPGATTAQDLEPEYIAVSDDGAAAYVALQENNALAVVSIATATVDSLVALGFKDHSLDGNGLDPSNRDDAISIATHPVWGMYQPDAIAWFSVGDESYIISANEGDARDYDGFSEEVRVADLTLDATAFPNAAALQADEVLGRLRVTDQLGDDDNDEDFDALYAFGGRSISVWGTDGTLVADTGSAIEDYFAANHPAEFNSTNDENDTLDDRSDDKGPEPEGVVVANIDGVPHAFVGMERIGGIMSFCLADPANPQIESYTTDRDFGGDPEMDTAGDLGPEGLLIIEPEDSPTGDMLLVVASEVSGSTTIYAVVAE